MGRESVTKKYNTFVRGLITEASAVNFPEDASVDENNMHLHRDGSRERRLGMNYESGYAKNSNSFLTELESETSFFSWDNTGVNSDKSFLVAQVGRYIDIFESVNGSYGAYKKRFELDVDTPSIDFDGGSSRVNHPFSFTTANGALYCAQKASHPFYITYDDDTDDFTITTVELEVRDIWGVPLGIATDITNHPTTLAGNDGWFHRYNLANAGWPDEEVFMATTTGAPPVSGGANAALANPIDETLSALGYAPSLADSYWLSFGLLAGTFNPQNVVVYRPDMLTTNPLMYLRMPRGRFIIKAFIKDRSDRISIAYSGTESQDTGSPSLVESFAGRVWYSGVESSQVSTSGFDDKVKYNSTVFFSQILETLDHAKKCYQENDPTSKDFSEILDTDGGTIELAGAGKIQRLISMHNFLVVLADNGIWTITGGPSGFTASSYSVRKVSNIGCISPKSVVEVEGSVLYWSLSGIYALAVDPESQDVRTQNITETTIQTRYQEIPDIGKRNAYGFFDANERRVAWVYNDDTSFDGIEQKWIKNKEIYFDLVLRSWSTYSISSLAANTPYIMGAVAVPVVNSYEQQEDVTDGAVVVTDGGVAVTSGVPVFSAQGPRPMYLCQDAVGQYTLGDYLSTNFFDWVTEDGTGVDFTSYLITGYENLNETGRKKQAVYMTAHFERTENQFISDGAGGAILDNQSGCKLQARWDWADHANSGKWGNEQDIYRLKRLYTPTGTLPETFDNGYPITTTKNKLRGTGRSSHLKFTSESGKDMHLLGWQIEYKGKEKV